MADRFRVLFVCGKNLRRSPTAERLYRNDPRLEVRSAGVSEKSRRRISEGDLEWADLILVMEKRHKSRIVGQWPAARIEPPIESLDIPDDYEWMDPELIELLQDGIETRLIQSGLLPL